MEIRNSPNKFGQTTFSSVLYGKILVNDIIPFRIRCPRPDSNRHGHSPQPPQDCMSTNFTTWA